MPSHLEAQFKLVWRAIQGHPPTVEHRFHPLRKWRFDFAWPEAMVAVEIEGAVWTNGRHTRGSGFVADCDKYNEAALLGWRIIRLTSKSIHDVDLLRRVKEIVK